MKLRAIKIEFEAKVDEALNKIDRLRNKTKESAGDMERRFALAEGKLKSFAATSATALAAGAAAGGAALGKFTGEALATARQLEELSQQTNTSASGLQRIQAAFRSVGKDGQAAVDVLTDMNERIGEALIYGTGEAAEALQELNIPLKDLEGLRSDEQFVKIADALARLDDASRAAALGAQLVGEQGNQINAILVKGEGYIRRTGDEWERVGRIMADDTVAAAADAKRELDGLFGLLRDTGTAELNRFADEIDFAAGKLRDFLELRNARAQVDRRAEAGDLTAQYQKTNREIAFMEDKLQRMKDGGLFDANLGFVPLAKRDQDEVEQRLAELQERRANLGALIAEQNRVSAEAAEREAEAVERTAQAQGDGGGSGKPSVAARETAEAKAQQAALERQMREDLELRNALLVAEAEGDREKIANLEKRLELRRLIAEFDAAGVEGADARLAAERQIAAVEQAKADRLKRTGGTAVGVAMAQYGGFASEQGGEGEDGRKNEELQRDMEYLFRSAFSRGTRAALQGDFKGALAGVLDSVFNSALNGLMDGIASSLFGGSGGSGGIGGFVSSLFGRATGGPVMSRKPYLVGEFGPELFMPSTAGTIASNAATQRAGGGANVTVNNLAPGTHARATDDGRGNVEITVETMQADFASRGPVSRMLEDSYGLTRQGF